MRFDTWAEFLEHQRRQPYMRQISDFVKAEQLIAHDIQRAGLITKNITATFSSHPSPKSVNLGFFGSRPFSRANLALALNNPGCAPVDWRLS